MRATTLLVSAMLSILPAFADDWGQCACQSRTDGPTVDSATLKCCTEAGTGVEAKMLKIGTLAGDWQYPGKYCHDDISSIKGGDFFACCKQNGAADSTCNTAETSGVFWGPPGSG